jgi:hypothetical protein
MGMAPVPSARDPSYTRHETRNYLRSVDSGIVVDHRPSPSRQELLRAAQATLAALGRSHWEPVGSSSCGTGIAGFSDVDVVAVFHHPVHYGVGDDLVAIDDDAVLPYSMKEIRAAIAAGRPRPRPLVPGAVYDIFAHCLQNLVVRGYGAPVRDFPAVRFPSLTADPPVELVPGCEADFLWNTPAQPSSALVRVAFPASRDRWLGTEPALHAGILDVSPGGMDYTARELIRLLKLVKYRRNIPVMSYSLELYALRWIEGSERFPAENISQIIAEADHAWTRRTAGYLIDDVVSVLAALAEQLGDAGRCGVPLRMIDLTTPETTGTVDACANAAGSLLASSLIAACADEADAAREAADRGDLSRSRGIWRGLVEP